MIRFYGPGGGGRGNPLDRSSDRVLRDVERGALSLQAARADYGVIISGGEVNENATKMLRDEMRAGQDDDGHFDFGPERVNYERRWTQEAYNAMSEIMNSLPVHWRFFVKARIFDAMNESETGGADLIRDTFRRIAADHPQIGVSAE